MAQGQIINLTKILDEAKSRWFQAAELCEILCNYNQLLPIQKAVANLPEAGSLFLYNRRHLRNFRKDGHMWGKKKESHLDLKIGGKKVLSCYYNRGEENINFRRRSYWMLEKSMEHIVLVHYREQVTIITPPLVENNTTTTIQTSHGQTELDDVDSGIHFSAMSPNAFQAGLEGTLMVSEIPGSSSNPPGLWHPGQECNDWVDSSLWPSPHNSSKNASFGVYEDEQPNGSEITSYDLIDAGDVNAYFSFEDWPMEEDVQVAGECSQKLFSIHDFLPEWGFSGTRTKVMIVGKFLESEKSPRSSSIKWGCMFGDIEVPAELIAENVIRCEAPPQAPGRVPFFVTCSDSLACSEAREYHYVDKPSGLVPEEDVHFQTRLANMLYLGGKERKCWDCLAGCAGCKLRNNLYPITSVNVVDSDVSIERLFPEKLYDWLIYKSHEGGKWTQFQDDGGLGVIHLTAGLGYKWAMAPIVDAGVNVNFRDKHGRTALHWASHFGREETVISLVRLGANLGAFEDPTSVHPRGFTVADLAHSQGHKGIAGYLAKAYLENQLSSLTVDTNVKSAGQDVPFDVSLELLKGPLAAVQKSAHVAASIQEAYRTISFRRRQLENISSHENTDLVPFGSLNKVQRHSVHFEDYLHVNVAVAKSQQKHRGLKEKRESLQRKKRIHKNQALKKGHQNAIGVNESSGSTDDCDFLSLSRKEKLVVVDKALSRVQSMSRYPEAREQYMRLVCSKQIDQLERAFHG
ncbi:hypothetical protein ACFE04_030956 [Oxalis oulophora]